GQTPADPPHDGGVVLWPRDQIEYLLLRLLVGEPEFERLGAIKLRYVRLIQDEQGNRARRQSFEHSRRNQSHMPECWASEHRVENRLAHPADDVIEVDRRQHIDAQPAQKSLVREVGLLHLQFGGPRRHCAPAMADHAYAPDGAARRLNGPQQPLHRLPAKFAVANVEHRELLGREVQRLLPARVVSVEQERAYVWKQRMKRRLADLVGEAVADLPPAVA